MPARIALSTMYMNGTKNPANVRKPENANKRKDGLANNVQSREPNMRFTSEMFDRDTFDEVDEVDACWADKLL